MDIGTGLALFGSAELLAKLLGPTAQYLGEGLKSLTQKRIENLKNIFDSACRRLGDRIDEEGTVPPRVLQRILLDGSYCDDFVCAEYLGGVLASSRSGVSRDDRGACFVSLISSMSTYQIRTHYVLYHILKQQLDGTSLNFGLSAHSDMAKLYVPWGVYTVAMDFADGEDSPAIVSHALQGLAKHDLIEGFRLGSAEYIGMHFEEDIPDKGGGLTFEPHLLGAELFLWAHGKRDVRVQDLLKEDTVLKLDPRIRIVEGCMTERPAVDIKAMVARESLQSAGVLGV